MKSHAKPKILCVDDEPHVLDALTRTLREDFNVLTANGASEALSVASENPDCSIVMTDYAMPGMDGIQFLRKVKSVLPFATRAILSAQIDLGRVSEAINASDIHRFFLKPWENEVLKIQMLETLKLQSALWLSLNDPVTGLHNHRFFQEQLEYELEAATQDCSYLSLMMLDVDHFKSFNDRFGHPEGDRLLKAIAEKTFALTPSSSFCCRYGGEEFAILLPKTTAEGAFEIAENLRRGIERSPVPGLSTGPTYVTVSIGVACFPAHAVSCEELIQAADRALYQAKRQGRNQSVLSSNK